MIVVKDVIKEVVDAVRLRYDVTENKRPFYDYGHVIEMINNLKEKDQSATWKYDKFPLIMLIQDFDEQITGEFHSANINLIFAEHTKQEYKAGDRYINTFTPVLYPLVEMFFEELKMHRMVNNLTFEFTKTDHLYWGTNNKNTGGDYIDAIEIKDLKINLLRNC